MQSIEIKIEKLYSNIYMFIDVNKHILQFKNKDILITEEKLNELLRIIINWEPSYYSNKLIDGEKFEIKINMKNKKEIIKGVGAYPENYYLFKKWIGEYYEWWIF